MITFLQVLTSDVDTSKLSPVQRTLIKPTDVERSRDGLTNQANRREKDSKNE